MNEILKVRNLFVVFGLISLSKGECGNALHDGALICNIAGNVFRPFRSNICTHASIEVKFTCENETCSVRPNPVLEPAIDSLIEKIPIGLNVIFEQANEDFLHRRSRRVNTAKSVMDFMKARNLTFMVMYEESWRKEFKNNERRNCLDLIEHQYFDNFWNVQYLAEPFHARGWHIAMSLEVNYSGLFAKYDLLDLATFVDWFSIPAHREERVENGVLYIGSAYPLAYKNNETGSTKFYIDIMLKWIKPECLVIAIDLRAKGYKALDNNLDPGPGSKAHPYFTSHPYKEICQKIQDNNCYEGWDAEANTPFSACGVEYYSYENATSIQKKVDLINSYNLAGVMMQSSHIDDDQGLCGKGRYPNFRAAEAIKRKKNNMENYT